MYHLKSVLCYPLLLIFNKSLSEGLFPDIWKVSSVSPIFKSGDKSNVSNYRPISKICHIAKLFESLVLPSIQKSVNHVLIDEQHGFRSGRSTTTCNAIFTSYVLDAFSNRSKVDIIYTDFAKAFDHVNHKALLQVLRATGFGEPLLSWFESYVTGRKQFVKFNGVCSSMVNITSGVPRGGHLSPAVAVFPGRQGRQCLP